MPSKTPAVEAAAMRVDWPRFVRLIRSKDHILLATHVRPDCDAVGSELAMLEVLTRLGKTVGTANPFELPPGLGFLDPGGRLRPLGEVPPEELDRAELLLVLDTTAWAQLGEVGELIRTTRATVAVVDHHVSGDDLGAELFKDTTAEATGRLVYEAARQLGVEVTPQIAVPLFAALATDTGWYRFSSTTGETFELAARLARAGARPDTIYEKLYETETLARLNLTGRVLAKARTELDGRLIHTWIGLEDFRVSGALPSDSEDLINMTLAVGGTQVAVILVERPGGKFKISFRSRCDLDCSELAGRFGGGGHKKAAGATVDGPREAAQAKILDAVRGAMR